MWCEAIVQIKQTMKNHCFNGMLYGQEVGGSIGLDLTGVIAENMAWWDNQLVVLLNPGTNSCDVLHKICR